MVGGLVGICLSLGLGRYAVERVDWAERKSWRKARPTRQSNELEGAIHP